MSTTWYVPIHSNDCPAAICKMTNWKVDHAASKAQYPKGNCKVLTDGEFFIHCDTAPITIVKHGRFAVLERSGSNYCMDDVLANIDGAFNEHDDDTIINCDNCGAYTMTNEIVCHNDECLCSACAPTKKARR